MDQTLLKHQPNPQSDPSQISEEVIALTPDLLAHPLFLHTDDKILTIFIESLKSIIIPVPDTMKLQIQKTNFDTYLKETMQDGRPPQQLFEDLHKANTSSTTTCSKSITPNELYFRCLDCEVITDPSQISHMCQDCFHKSQHDGHRILKGKPLSPCTCDCGRSQSLSEAGFCPNHKAQDQTVEEILADFPKIIRSQVTEVFRKAVYGIICLFEIEEKAKGKKTKTIINALARSFTDQLLGYYLFLVQRVSRLFNLVIERLLQSSFETPNNLVWHDCSDLKDENQNKNCELEQPTQCNCTVLGCLLRFSKFFGPALQGKLNIVFMESCKEKSSKQFLNKELIKHVYFIVGDPLSSTGDFKKVNSKQSELLTNEVSITENDIESLDHFLGALKRVLSDFSDPDSDKYLEILCFQAPLEKFLVQDSKASLRVLKETDLFSKLLALLSDFHANMVQPQTIKLESADQMIDYGFFSVTLSAERYMCSSLDHAFKKIGDLESEDKDSLFRGIAKTWYDCYHKTQSTLIEQRTVKGKTSFQAGLERALCLMMVHYLQNNITQERVESFLKNAFPEVNSSSVASDAVSGVIASLGLVRFTDVIKTPATRSMNGYYYNLLSIFETDTVLIQAMTLFINPKDIFNLFVKNFFSYSQELQEFCLSFGSVQNVINHPCSRKMILVVEDFLNFITFLMNDEICLVNLNARKDLGRKPDSSIIERAIRKLLVNILVQKGWIDINSVKSLVSLFVFEEAQDCTDNVISEITTRDEITNKVKLKEEYEKDIDLNVFFKHYNGQREEHNKLTRAGGNSETCDIISGAFYPDLPEYMVELQHNMFQSQLSEFVCHILTNFSKEISHLVQPALRLVLFNLRALIKSLDTPNSKTEGLQKKVEAIYLKESFLTTLNGIQASGDFKECESSIKNIKSLIKQLSPQLLPQSVEEGISEDPKEKTEEEKKKQAKEKMEKVKEEFANKQALFAEKNDHNKQEPNLAEKSGLVCQCCLDKIQEISGEEYGVPIYVEFTNNFYNIEEEVVFTEQDYSAWWPVVSSCNHFYHKRCFETHLKNSRGPQNMASKLFINEYETQCALCKTLCNNFLVVNTDFGKEGSSEKYCQEFVKKIENIMSHLKENLFVFNPEKAKDQNNDVCSEEIFKRSYEYLIESFHLHEKAQSLEATLKLHTNFFKVFKGYLQTNQHHSLDSKSLLQTLVENHDRTGNEKVYLELKVERILFNLLQEQEVTVNEYVRVIKEYVLASLVNFAHLERPDKATNLEDIILLYKENKEFRDKVASEFSFPMQKILLAYYFNRNVLHSNNTSEITDFCEIICSSQDDNQKIDLLLKHAQLSLTFEQLIEDSLSLLPTLIKSEKDLLNSLLDSQTPSLKIAKLKLEPRFVELPQNYLEFSQKCITKRCNVCKGHSPRLVQTICLICGESMCGVVCAGGPGPGNLSKHAINHHFGLGLFYCIDNHSLMAIKYNVGLYFSFGNGYTDEQGRPFKVLLAQNDFDTIGIKKDLDFKRFVLDKKVRDLLREVVTHHSVGQQIFENVFKNPTGYTNTHTF